MMGSCWLLRAKGAPAPAVPMKIVTAGAGVGDCSLPVTREHLKELLIVLASSWDPWTPGAI